MGRDRPLHLLRDRLNRFELEMVRLFDWHPSPHFRSRLAIFARSVGPDNAEDLLSLAALEASDWHSQRPAEPASPAGGPTSRGSSCLRTRGAHGAGTDRGSTPSDERRTEQSAATEPEPCRLRDSEAIPETRVGRPAVPSAHELCEKMILRALDRERQTWRREARRSKTRLENAPPPQGRYEDPGVRMASAEIIDMVQRFVVGHYLHDDRILFEARFWQGLSYKEIAAILEHKYSVPALRKRADRIQKGIRRALGGVLDS